MPSLARVIFLAGALVCASSALFTACGGDDSLGGTGGTAFAFVCGTSKPETTLGTVDGYQQCSDGVLHRAAIVACPSTLPRTTTCTSGMDQCHQDSDCPGLYPTCNKRPNPPAGDNCLCATGCVSDADCGPNAVCVCADPVGACLPASCKSDADCPAGRLCAGYLGPFLDCTRQAGFACQTPDDTCAVDADCPSGTGGCVFDGKKRTCLATVTTCTR